MILEYKFEYISNNNTLINFFANIAKKEDINVKLTKSNNEINFYVEGDEDQLLSFSDKLSIDLPVSMFLKNTSVDVAQEIPTNSAELDIKKEYNLSFCPTCMNEVDNKDSNNYYNPFTTCEMCTDTSNIKELIITQNGNTEHTKKYEEVFEKLANDINDGLKVKIKTLSGVFVFEKIDNLKEQNEQKDVNLLCLNLINISNVLVAKKSEVVALASIEKPELELRINEVYKYKNIIKTDIVNVRYLNDLILFLLSKHLIAHGIDFLSYSKDGSFDISVDFEGFDESEKIDIPKIKVLDNDRVVVLDSNNYENKLTTLYEKFDEESQKQSIVLLGENDLFKKKILNFFNSSEYNDNIVLYSNDLGGFLDILKYTVPNSMQELFDEISDDETGGKLLINFKKHFPECYENALKFDTSVLTKNSLLSLWKIVSAVLDFEDDVISLASACMLEKGPRIDYKLLEQEEIYNKTFNLVKFIKSGISFKLAGVENSTISLGYIESYTHFVANVIDEVNEEVVLDGVSLSGDIFSHDIISTLLHKSITKNYKIFYNKDFPIQITK